MGSTTRSFAAFGRKTRHYPYNGRRSAASGQRNCANAAALKPEYDVVSGAPQEEQHGLPHDLASRLTKIALASTMGAETARNVSAFRVFRTRLREGFQEYRSPYAAVVLIVASTGYSLLILRSDAEFANFGRDAMYRLITPHVAAGERVWFGGQYWSYWYAPLAGATLTFPGGPQPKPGDLLVVDVFSAWPTAPSERFPNRTLVDVITHSYRFGRTMGAGAGLYSNRVGYWLWAFGDSGRDRYELWRID